MHCFLLKAQPDRNSLLLPYRPWLDTALLSINMRYSDLSIPWDATDPDKFRSGMIKNLFQDPLRSIDEVKNQSDFIRANISRPSQLYTYIAEKLQPVSRTKISPIVFDFREKCKDAGLIKLFGKDADKVWQAMYYANESGKMITQVYNSLPENERKYLTDDFVKFLIDEDIMEKFPDAISSQSAEEKSLEISKKAMGMAGHLDMNKIFTSGAMFYHAALQLTDILKTTRFPSNPLLLKTAYGTIYYGTNPPAEADIIILPATDDKIRLPENILKSRIVIDLGGDDYYQGDKFSIGAGLFCNNIIIDLGGDDIYKAGLFSEGAGIFGNSILLDIKGDDHYLCDKVGQGLGLFGTGLLIDSTGNDAYEGNEYVQAVGRPGGFGLLMDLRGNDTYLAHSGNIDNIRYDDHYFTMAQGIGLGLRPFASGGIGLLLDARGNDNYIADIYGQGSGYWYGLGGLLDAEGNDNYTAFQYCQGAGVHSAFGILIDEKGNDAYRGGHISLGSGHDLAFGALIEKEGNDRYICESLSMGGGNANSPCLFLDAAGDDAYMAISGTSLGYHDFRRGQGKPGLFLDLGGKDWYAGTWGKDEMAWQHGTFGAAMDRGSADKIIGKEKADEKELIKKSLAKDLEGLFLQASSGPIQFNNLVKPARDSLTKCGPPALKYLLSKINTSSPREGQTLYLVLPLFGEAAVPQLIDSVHSKEFVVAGRCLDILKESAKNGYGKGYIKEFSQLTSNPDWRIRSGALDIIAAYKDSTNMDIFINHFSDANALARKSAAYGLSTSGTLRHFEYGRKLLMDSTQPVRYLSQMYFRRLGPVAEDYIFKNIILAKNLPAETRMLGIQSLNPEPGFKTENVNALLVVLDEDWRFRIKIAELAANGNSVALKDAVLQKTANDPNPFVKQYREQMLKAKK